MSETNSFFPASTTSMKAFASNQSFNAHTSYMMSYMNMRCTARQNPRFPKKEKPFKSETRRRRIRSSSSSDEISKISKISKTAVKLEKERRVKEKNNHRPPFEHERYENHYGGEY